MIGDSGVGKTSLVLRYDENSFSHKFVTTIGVDYRDKVVDVNGKNVKLQIWDTAGQERFRSLTSNFFSRADGMLLTFDVSARESFEHIKTWMSEIRKHAPEDVDVVICGSKCDVEAKDRTVTYEEGKALADDEGVPYFEASAKTNTNVEEMFMHLATTITGRKLGGAAGGAGATGGAALGDGAGGLANPANIALGGGDKKSGPPCC